MIFMLDIYNTEHNDLIRTAAQCDIYELITTRSEQEFVCMISMNIPHQK